MVTDADFGWPAWRGFIEFAYNQPWARTRFTTETGMPWPSHPRGAVDAMIDKGTGHLEKHAEAFVLWASKEYGVEFCPPSVQEAIAAQESP